MAQWVKFLSHKCEELNLNPQNPCITRHGSSCLVGEETGKFLKAYWPTSLALTNHALCHICTPTHTHAKTYTERISSYV